MPLVSVTGTRAGLTATAKASAPRLQLSGTRAAPVASAKPSAPRLQLIGSRAAPTVTAAPTQTTPITNGNAGGVRVLVAFGLGETLLASPTWTNITDHVNLVASVSIDRGRQYELDRTDTGTAQIVINDVAGILDPTYSLGPYYNHIEPLLQVRVELRNPVTGVYSPIYRGYIEDYDYAVHPSQRVNQLTLGLVDAFEILQAIEMQPNGSFGDPPPKTSAGNIYFEPKVVGPTGGDSGRIAQALNNAGWPVDLQTIFSGNIFLKEAVYSPGETVLQVIQDCADAEFPGVANVYVSRDGHLTFHGRKAKFDPVGVSAGAGGAWTFTHWQAGDAAAVGAGTGGTAQIRGMSYNRGLSKIINSAFATPNGIENYPDQATVFAGQGTVDAASVGLYGYRSWSAENLLTDSGLNDGNDDLQETLLFARYYVDNYAEPRNRVQSLQFKAMDPHDPRATANWRLICGVEISDMLDLTVSFPGGGGFNLEPFFVEGVHYEIQPANNAYPDVTVTLDLSPQAYFSFSPFTGDH